MRMMNTREKRDEKKDIEDGLITAKEAWELQAELVKKDAIDKDLVKQLSRAFAAARSKRILERCSAPCAARSARSGTSTRTKNAFAEQVKAYERETGKKFKPRGKNTWRLNRREAEVPEGSMTYYAKGLCYACGEPAMIGCRTPRERTELLLEVPTKPHACPLCGEQEALHLDVTATFRKEQ